MFSCFICVFFLLHSFCLKGEALDGKSSAVIDYTPYLKFTQRYVHWHCKEKALSKSIESRHVLNTWNDNTLDTGRLKINHLTASVVAMITWVMMTIDRVLTAAQATTASPTTHTSPWSLTRRAGAQSVARWSRGSRSSMLRRWAAVFLCLKIQRIVLLLTKLWTESLSLSQMESV